MFYYVALEPYKERYTYQLLEWTERRLTHLGIDYHVVQGQNFGSGINVGQVLDAHGRSYYSLTQMAELVKLTQSMTSEDVIFFEDMFTPGIESLAYIFDQLPANRIPRVYVRCLAQTIDPDDFVNSTGMFRWMNLYEKMVNEFVTGILCTNEEMVAYAKVAGWKNLYNIGGLSFGIDEVRSRVSSVKPFKDRPRQVIFASRLDMEKQIPFMVNVFDSVHQVDPSVKFVVCCGSKLRSNDRDCLEAIEHASYSGLVELKTDLSKNEYYEQLNNSRVLFNSSLQDWTSNTVSEADALGCNLSFPAYRSFPEVFNNDHRRMYIPWSVESARDCILSQLDAPSDKQGQIAQWNDHTIDRYIDLIYNSDARYDRSSYDYRKHVNGLWQ